MTTITGPRIKNVERPTFATMTACNEMSDLIEAATKLAEQARVLGLRSTAEQVRRIAAQLDVMRTVLIAEGDQHMPVAVAYIDVCADRLAVHGGYVGRCAHDQRR